MGETRTSGSVRGREEQSSRPTSIPRFELGRTFCTNRSPTFRLSISCLVTIDDQRSDFSTSVEAELALFEDGFGFGI